MNKKIVIVYTSIHHENTLKLVKAIADKYTVDIIDATQQSTVNLQDYDVIGFASGIDFEAGMKIKFSTQIYDEFLFQNDTITACSVEIGNILCRFCILFVKRVIFYAKKDLRINNIHKFAYFLEYLFP